MGEAMPENRTSQGGAASDALPAVTAENEVRVIQQALANNGYTVDVDAFLASGRNRPSASSRPTTGWKRTVSSASRLFMPLPGRACPMALSAVSATAAIMAWPASKVRRLRISSTLPTSISAFPISLAVRRVRLRLLWLHALRLFGSRHRLAAQCRRTVWRRLFRFHG